VIVHAFVGSSRFTTSQFDDQNRACNPVTRAMGSVQSSCACGRPSPLPQIEALAHLKPPATHRDDEAISSPALQF
jgi:hypothetical protein